LSADVAMALALQFHAPTMRPHSTNPTHQTKRLRTIRRTLHSWFIYPVLLLVGAPSVAAPSASTPAQVPAKAESHDRATVAQYTKANTDVTGAVRTDLRVSSL